MIDFEIVYGDDIFPMTICSTVYAVDKTHFLIADAKGRFIWVPIKDCRLSNMHICDETTTESAWDSYDRIVAAGL